MYAFQNTLFLPGVSAHERREEQRDDIFSGQRSVRICGQLLQELIRIFIFQTQEIYPVSIEPFRDTVPEFFYSGRAYDMGYDRGVIDPCGGSLVFPEPFEILFGNGIAFSEIPSQWISSSPK